jgi:hypothetical protein
MKVVRNKVRVMAEEAESYANVIHKSLARGEISKDTGVKFSKMVFDASKALNEAYDFIKRNTL